MKFYHLLFMLYIGIILSSLLVIFFGNEGYYAFLKEKETRQILISNIEDLQQKNYKLQQKITLLKSNPRVMKILARKLGYFDQEENVILLRDHLSFSDPYEIGNVVNRGEPSYNPDPVLRIIGFSAGIFIILLYILARQRRKHGYHI